MDVKPGGIDEGRVSGLRADESLSAPLLPGSPAPRNAGEACPTSRGRFWVLLVYCLLSACQSCTWNVFSPINPAVNLAFPSWFPSVAGSKHPSQAQLNWLINSANISFLLALHPVSLAKTSQGPRRVTLFCAIMIFSGAAIRHSTADGV